MRHKDFILSPIINLLNETVTACVGVGDGMGTSTIVEHIMQSLFLRMTGFQEQKMKCICWELATYDYEYRYKRFKQNPLGECSCYKEKNAVINDIILCAKKIDASFTILTDKDKANIIRSVISDIDSIVLDTNLHKWQSRQYNNYKKIIKKMKPSHFLILGQRDAVPLFIENKSNAPKDFDLFAIYDKLYRHRNRCAHNLLSYQENLPTLSKLLEKDYAYENYFLRFAVLILIDKITIELYKKYLIAMSLL